MTNLEKIKYINEFDILDSLKEHSENFHNSNTEDILSSIEYEIKNKLELYSYDTYKKYKDELFVEFKDNIDELKKLIIKNCSPTVNKILWIKFLITLPENKN